MRTCRNNEVKKHAQIGLTKYFPNIFVYTNHYCLTPFSLAKYCWGCPVPQCIYTMVYILPFTHHWRYHCSKIENQNIAPDAWSTEESITVFHKRSSPDLKLQRSFNWTCSIIWFQSSNLSNGGNKLNRDAISRHAWKTNQEKVENTAFRPCSVWQPMLSRPNSISERLGTQVRGSQQWIKIAQPRTT